MTVNQKIIEALKPFEIPVIPDVYEGNEKEYCTFNYADDRGGDFGDNKPLTDIAYMQIHYFAPLKKDYLKKKREIRKALFEAGFTYPEVTENNEYENGIRHLVFECEIESEE